MFVGIDQIVVAVPSLGPACDDYRALLGRAPSWIGDDGGPSAVFRLGNASLRLLESAALAARSPVCALRFASDDVEQTAAWLRSSGFDLGSPAESVLAGAESFDWRRRELPLDPAQTRGLAMSAVEEVDPEDGPPAAAIAEGVSEREAVAGIDHVVIRAPAPDETIELYQKKLGIRLALDRRFEARGVRLVFFRIGGVTLELAARLDASPDPERPDVFSGIAYQVPEPAAVRARVAAAGFDVSPVRSGNKPGTAVCTVRDRTCGVPTLLIGPDSGA